MNDFRIEPINLDNKSEKYRWVIVILGVVWVINGAIRLFGDEAHDWFTYVYLAGGIGLILSYFVDFKKTENFHITFTNQEISVYISRFKKFKMSWDEVSEVIISVLRIDFLIKDERIKKVDLSQFEYKEVITLKEKVKEFAEEKNISEKQN